MVSRHLPTPALSFSTLSLSFSSLSLSLHSLHLSPHSLFLISFLFDLIISISCSPYPFRLIHSHISQFLSLHSQLLISFSPLAAFSFTYFLFSLSLNIRIFSHAVSFFYTLLFSPLLFCFTYFTGPLFPGCQHAKQIFKSVYILLPMEYNGVV